VKALRFSQSWRIKSWSSGLSCYVANSHLAVRSYLPFKEPKGSYHHILFL
jgi:hypothetical protein